MEGAGGIVVLRVSGVHTKLKGIVPGRPEGITVTQRDGPSPETQGMELNTRPPKGKNPTGSAHAVSGSISVPIKMKVASSLPRFCTFPLYTGYIWASEITSLLLNF
jgi:hypothetical protein